jgi:MFS family permease
MPSAILSVRSLLVSVFLLAAGSGFMATLVSLQLEASGASPLLIGPVATAYFVGLTVGSLRVTPVIQRVGHIRAFAAFVSLFSASSLAYVTYESAAFWAGLRFIDGFCMAGIFVCVESWLNDQAEPHTRGTVLAVYMVALYAGQAVGQFLLAVSADKPSMPFIAASILISLAVLPVALTRMAGPVIAMRRALGLRWLFLVSPLGMVGAGVTGLMLGAFYALGAVHARRLGLDLPSIATFMSAVIAGGIVLQWPIGRLSDLLDRRRVIIGAFAAAALVCAGMALLGEARWALLPLGALFGGLSFALYPLCVAHTNDHLSAEDRVSASGGLVLAYSVGAAAGPVPASAAMTVAGPAGLYAFIGLCAVGGLAFGLWRTRRGEPVPATLQQPYRTLPRTTPMSASLDPQAPAAGEAGS